MKFEFDFPTSSDLSLFGGSWHGRSKPIFSERAHYYISLHPDQNKYALLHNNEYFRFVFDNVKIKKISKRVLIFPAARPFNAKLDDANTPRIYDDNGDVILEDGKELVWTIVIGFEHPRPGDVSTIPKLKLPDGRLSDEDAPPEDPFFWEHPTSEP